MDNMQAVHDAMSTYRRNPKKSRNQATKIRTKYARSTCVGKVHNVGGVGSDLSISSDIWTPVIFFGYEIALV